MTEGTDYTVSTDAYSDKDCETVVNKEDMVGGETYYLKITGKGAFKDKEATVYFAVKKKTLTVNCTTTFQRDYGSSDEPTINQGTEFTVIGLVEGNPWNDTKAELGTLTYTYAGKGQPNYKGGVYNITFGGLSSNQYDIVYPTETFTIVGRNMTSETTVTVKDRTKIADKTYKGAEFTPAELSGVTLVWNNAGTDVELTEGTDFTYAKPDDADWTNAADNIAVTVNFIGNYSGSKTTLVTFNIKKAQMSVDLAQNYTVYYSGEAQGLVVPGDDASDDDKAAYANLFAYYGYQGADQASKTIAGLSTTMPAVTIGGADTQINANEDGYAISIGAQTSTNYVITPLNKKKFIIKKMPITIAATAVSKNAGDADPALTYTIKDKEGNDVSETNAFKTISEVLKKAVVKREAGENPGKYALSFSDKGEVSDNYAATYDEKAVFTINASGLTVTIMNYDKFYGQADPESWTNPVEDVDYVVSGLLAGDKLGTFTITRATADADKENVGSSISLTANIANPNAEHYSTVTVVPGMLTINKARLYFTIPTQSLEIGVTATALSKKDITATGKYKDADVLEDLYELAFNTGVTLDVTKTNTDETVADGKKLTLTTEALSNYVLVNADDEIIDAATGKLIIGKGTVSTLQFTSVDDDYNKIVAHAGETQNVTLTINPRNAREVPAGKVHTWKASIWNTMVLPFDAEVRNISKALGYAIVNVVNKEATTEGKVAFKLTMGTIPANTPFMVKTDKDVENGQPITFENVKIVAPADEYPSVDAGNGYKFVGAYKTKTISKETPYFEFMRGDTNVNASFDPESDKNYTWNVLPFDAYIDKSGASASARMGDLTITFEELDGTTTAVRSINVDNEPAGSKSLNGWYNLNGVKIEEPTQKGIYIHNGKKVVIK